MSGGNVYDRRASDGLRDLGWQVAMVEVGEGADAASALRSMPDDALVLVDGLVAGWAPAAMVEAAGRLRLVVLAHMVVASFPDATEPAVEAERRVLAAARGVIVPSRWAAAELARRGLVPDQCVRIAVPGVDVPVHPAEPSGDGALLCVGVIAPHKGQDTLLDALAALPDVDWTCALVGAADADPDFASEVAARAAALGERVQLLGVLDEARLAALYRRSALLVAPSRVETGGMAVAEARAHGLPVVGADTGGIADALADGGGILVAPDDPDALAAALRGWLCDPELRRRLRGEALAARAALPRWSGTVADIARALEAAA
ncbi:glycosyltransferase family 4 protein [Microbacterium sp. M3]|uniref:D-inositol 3-phosphate glycosyltransferase n=1 Tax=Microbacterium arthrosphaerae TaxID=792652 RepID=A0ABU4GXB5_9MICO|nr:MULTISPECIES: glycosyltransferase family 4 protein [Microbacterium]MDW4571726.1 glycosyltransferase family 4 protein [Microbacterium arthrosphaerae]MDW7605581.1 glycosyltransferase family 4 protein [Microbacterium sp. M3]